MTDPLSRLSRFLRELKRRNVYRVAATYAVVGFVLIEAADLIFVRLGLPSWTVTFVIVLVAVGFPLALILAWAFEMTAEGVRRTPEAEEGAPEPSKGGAGGWIAAFLFVLLAGGGVWYTTGWGEQEPAGEAAAPTDTVQARDGARAERASPGRPFVAVLPLENLSPKEENRFFAEGIHEEILTQLSKVSGLGVLSRTTMMEYEDAEMTASEIGRELDVQAILEGTVRRAGDRVRISAQLIDPASGDHRWAETYERKISPEAIFNIQADIARKIAGALETQLAAGEQERLEEAPTEDLAAYDAFLRGRNQLSEGVARQDLSLLDRALESFREAVRRDSSFAQARAWLGRAHYERGRAGGGARGLDSAAAQAERALTLDPELAEAHVAAAFVYAVRDSASARLDALRRALELQPNHAVATAELSEALRDQGRWAEAVRVAREAVQLDPRNPWVLQEMGDQLAVVGFDDAAKAWYRRVLEVEPGHFDGVLGLALTQEPQEGLETWARYLEGRESAPPPLALFLAAEVALQAGEPERAGGYLRRIPEARRQRTLDPAPVRSERRSLRTGERATLGLAEIRSGNVERGRQLLREAADSLFAELERESDLSREPIRLAEVLAALGEREQALRQLEQSGEVLRRFPQMVLDNTWFESLQADPRFQEITREIEARRQEAREKVLRMGLDLYPPGAEPDTAGEAGGGRR